MRIGITAYIQNDADWARSQAVEAGEDAPVLEPNTDAQFFTESLDEAVLVEELGYDSYWVVEHHVSPYTMIPSPLMMLGYIAGRTRRVDVGTMVVVIPWHNPLRVAEEMSMLQLMLGDRTPYIGFGRGAARREYRAYGVDQNESRERFDEGVEIVKLALTQDSFSFDGQFFQYENVSVRPKPRDGAKLVEDLHFAWGSPASAPLGAALGLKAMIIPQKDLDDYHTDLAQIAEAHEKIGKAPSRPRLHLHMYCHEDQATAEAAAVKHIREHSQSAIYNYELLGSHFANLKGYEHYAGMAGSGVGLDGMSKPWIQNSVWGTPERCLEQIRRLCDTFHPEEFMLTGRYGSMTHEEGVRSMELFAEKVLPAAREIPHEAPIAYTADIGA
jgi:alkanesulfonate monooxygenase SsuD/methylene tetrahydromethanopterin reductase-like flavin-dependent oxidoreductase (luciferase family)